MASLTTGAENVRWDLSPLHSSLTDPQIDADAATLVENFKIFRQKHRGRLSETLGQAIADYADLNMLENKITGYLFLSQSTAVADSAIKAKMAEIEKTLSAKA